MAYVIFARWFALVSLFLSLGILFNLEDARDMAKSMIKTETGYIMGGVFPIIFGSLALVFVNSFSSGWSILVSLIGAIMVGIGLFRVFFVKRWKTLLDRYIDEIPFLFSLFGLMFAVVLGYVGFFSRAF